MSHARTIPEGLEALSAELREVEWFGRDEAKARPVAVQAPAALDLALVTVGAALGAAAYLFVWV